MSDKREKPPRTPPRWSRVQHQDGLKAILDTFEGKLRPLQKKLKEATTELERKLAESKTLSETEASSLSKPETGK